MPLRLPSRPLVYRRALILLVHIALIPLAYLTAFELRFDFRIPPTEFVHFSATVWYLLAIRLLVFQPFGLYRGYWKHVGLKDLVDLSAAVTLSSVLFASALPLLGLMTGMPRSVFLLDWVMMIFFSGGIRFAARALRESQLARTRLDDGRRTLIIGAGEGGEQLLRQLLHDPRAGMNVVGFVDDKRETHGRTLHGVPVLGHTGQLRALVGRHQVELLVIAIRGAAAEQTRRIVDLCRETGIEFKIIPSIDDLLAGRATIGQLRDVEIDDLLGREPVTFKLEQIKRDLAGKSILVTGGAGSIGSELARQIASYGPARLVLLERAENALYFTHLEVAKAYPEVEVVPFIGSITNPDRLEEMFRLYRPNYVFHAAAYKHVPMLESNVTEAVWNNVFGTLRVAECAALHGVEKFVLISTDKAVNPTSVLGATKRIVELAEQLIRLSGLEPYRDIQIAFTGLRPGEKLAEELVACAEDTVATSVDKIRVIQRNGADGPAVERHLEHLLEILAHGSRDELIDAISRLVPEYVPWQARERPLLAPARARATPDPRSPLRPAYARTAGADGAPTSATA